MRGVPTTRLRERNRRGPLSAAVFIVLAALAVYANSLSVPFVFDDVRATEENPTIRHLWPPWDALSPPSDSPVGGRPLLNLSFALNRALNGEKVRGYHAFNLLVHALAALALFGIVRRTLSQPVLKGRFRAEATGLALAVTAIWVVYPVQTESVTYVSQRSESLMALFYLLCVYGFIRGAESSRPASWQICSVLACLLGAMSKETIMTAPAIVLLYDRTFVAGSFREAWRQRWRYYFGLASTWLLLVGLMTDLSRRGAGFGLGVTWWSYALTSCRSVMMYLKLAFWPHPLVFDYGVGFVHSAPEAAPYALVLAALLAYVAAMLLRRPALGFAGACFFVILAPTSSVVPVAGEPMAENRLYLPLAAVIALTVLGLHVWLGQRSRRVFAAAVLGLGWLSVRRNEDYKNAMTLWSDTVAKCPDNPRAHSNLGNELAKLPGRLPEALAHYEAALRIKPRFAEAHDNLANVLTTIPGRLPEALAHYEEALRIKPDYVEAHYNLAVALATIPGRMPEALAHYAEALRIKPDYAEAHYNLANALAKIPGRMFDALAHYAEALRINPNLAEAHYNLANALATIAGRMPDALAHYAEALRINPDFAEAHYDLANALATIPDRQPEASAHFLEALRIKPDYAEAHDNLAVELAKIPGRMPEALAHYAEALRINPDLAEAHYNLANALGTIPGRLPEALAHYEEALRIKPDYAEAHDNLAVELAKVSGRQPEALAHFLEALRIKPDYAEAHFNIAVLYVGTGRFDEAIAHWELALKFNPALNEARDNLNKLRAMLKQYDGLQRE